VTVDYEQSIDNVHLVLKGALDWLHANVAESPNRTATSWRLGGWNIEISYVYGEGVMRLWFDGHEGRRVVTRGRNDADLQLWIDTLEACRP
jgi:hypothetical protein